MTGCADHARWRAHWKSHGKYSAAAQWARCSNIESSRYDAGTAYISVDFHQVNKRDPFIL